ncbi:hypothetical protein ACFFQW_07910 [Umezawaea endophytica]|uniref:Uncharacterized protein n=1 Tax=Umezawaea endophytica TaxID=1654476 RepID=A0A9X2VNJ7_9PSEU|nr:hypothetical protein [Umezawaea endophytica]MCS7479976.1 hypothetical protein [Umezawaea endophytica]
MSVNNPDEWSQFRLWLNAQLEWLRCVEPQKDCRLLEEARGLFPAIGEEDGATRAVAELERLADKAWSAEGTTMLRHYLGYALVSRAVEVRRMLGPGGVVIVEGIADRVLALDTCDSELDEFAAALKKPKQARETRATPVFALLLVVLGVVPVVVGGLLRNGPLLSVGALLTLVLLCAFAWLLRATGAHRGARRPAHLGTGR